MNIKTMKTKQINSLVLCIAWFGALAILAVFLLFDDAQAAQKLRKARIPGGQAIDKAATAWDVIYDYQTILQHTAKYQNGRVKQFSARAYMTRPTKEKSGIESSFLLELFEGESGIPQDATPTKIFYADAGQNFYTVNPKTNTITIEKMNERTSPLPEEFMYLAGFLDFDIKAFKEKAYIHSDVYQETIDDVSTYRILIKPRKTKSDIEPPRYLWIDRKTSLPKQFLIEGDVEATILFSDTLINQGLKSEDLVPEVPKNAIIDDKR